MRALSTRGGQLAVATAAVLVLVIALAAGGAFAGCRDKAAKVGRPSAAVSSSPHGGVAYATAKVLAASVGKRPADTWGEIHARESVTAAFQQYGYFPLLDEFIVTAGGRRIHSANIIALKEGDTAKRLVVGAHYDSAAVGEGYTDNATGVGLLLEVAARVKNVPTPYTIVFVAFGAEENGSLGAKDYVRSMSDVERRATIGMLNLDAPAGGDDLSVASRFGGPTWLRDDALSAADSLGVSLTTSPETAVRPAGTVWAPADDVPFAGADIATAVFSAVSWEASEGRRVAQTADGPPIWHTPRDTVEYVDTTYPKRVRTQLRDLSRLLETLLTSKLEKAPVKLGIVGLPNVGKTTLFNALTHAHAAATAYAYTSAESNLGVVAVPDPRLDRLDEVLETPRKVNATIDVVDIAGPRRRRQPRRGSRQPVPRRHPRRRRRGARDPRLREPRGRARARHARPARGRRPRRDRARAQRPRARRAPPRQDAQGGAQR